MIHMWHSLVGVDVGGDVAIVVAFVAVVVVHLALVGVVV